VLQEIEQVKAQEVSLPMIRLDAGLKLGQVAFTWGELRQWLKPSPSTGASEQSASRLVLPLKAIAPLFMAQRKPGSAQKKIAVGENIPDLFAGLSAPVAAPAPAPTPEAVPRPVVPALIPVPAPAPVSVPSPAVPVAAAPAPIPAPAPVPAASANVLGEIFGQPSKTDWSPQEIVQKVSALPGVAGSMIAMADGLLVASQLPAGMKPETVAAFLPQMFTRMNHYSAEVQLGQLASAILQTNKAPFGIFKAGTLYLGALGRAGEPLPEAQLQRIAAEIAKRK
jgi:predicted regulator of Ras-like GTPase activity (Roadblock/LC7/MglB family)